MIAHILRPLRLSTVIAFGMGGRPRRNPSIPTQSSTMMPFAIQYLHDNPGSKRYPKQVGRGPGSGKGKFAGRGMKGDKARSGGGVHVRFEGGQTPLTRRIPKFGRVKLRKQKQILNYVNIASITHFVKKGIINPQEPITLKKLQDVGLAKKIKYGVKILGKGLDELDYPLHLEVSDASLSVIKKVQEAGGSVKLIFRTPLKLKQHLHPQKFPLALRDPLPPAFRVRKLDRLGKRRGLQVEYRKPKWKIEQQEMQKQNKESESSFVYPVPRVPAPEKVHVRKPKIYKKINYGI